MRLQRSRRGRSTKACHADESIAFPQQRVPVLPGRCLYANARSGTQNGRSVTVPLHGVKFERWCGNYRRADPVRRQQIGRNQRNLPGLGGFPRIAGARYYQIRNGTLPLGPRQVRSRRVCRPTTTKGSAPATTCNAISLALRVATLAQAARIGSGLTKGSAVQPRWARAAANSSAHRSAPCTSCSPSLSGAPWPKTDRQAIREGPESALATAMDTTSCASQPTTFQP